MNREDSVLDDIDRLVDESLSRGDRSDSFHGDQYREQQPCPWCGQGWHFLKITERMHMMRLGSYGQDEFGQGIVDPDYRHDEDDSMILCPGSEFHGPVQMIAGVKVWDKQGRERFASRSGSTGRVQPPRDPEPSLPPGRRRRLQFAGPFDPWAIAVDEERTIEDVVPGLPGAPFVPDRRARRPVVVATTLTATFSLDQPLKNPSPEWVNTNRHDIASMTITSDGTFVHMEDIVMPFAHMEIQAATTTQEFPDSVTFETTYPIERHPWFMEFWVISGTDDTTTLTPARPVPPPEEPAERRGFESPYVIIDEAYQHDTEELRRHAEEATQSSRPQGGQVRSGTTAQATGQQDG